MRKGERELDESFFGTEPEKKVDGSKIKEKGKKRKRKGNNEPNASAMEADLELAKQQVKREKLERNKGKMKEKIENGYNGGINLQTGNEKPKEEELPSEEKTEEKKVAVEVAADEKVIPEKEEIVEKPVDIEEENPKIEEEPNKEELSTQDEEKPEIQVEKPIKKEGKQPTKEEESKANIEELGESKYNLRSKDGKKIVLVFGKHGEESGLKPDEVYFGDLSEEEQRAIDEETIKKVRESEERAEKIAKEKAEKEAAVLPQKEGKVKEEKRPEEKIAAPKKPVKPKEENPWWNERNKIQEEVIKDSRSQATANKDKSEVPAAFKSEYEKSLARPEDSEIDYSKVDLKRLKKINYEPQQQFSNEYVERIEERSEEEKEAKNYIPDQPVPEEQVKKSREFAEEMEAQEKLKAQKQTEEIEKLNETVKAAAEMNAELKDKLAKTEQQLAEMKKTFETKEAAVVAEKNLSQKAKEGIKNFFTKHKAEKIIAAGLIGGTFAIAGPPGLAAGAAVSWMNYKTRKEVERIEKETQDIIEKTGYKPPVEEKKGVFEKIKGIFGGEKKSLETEEKGEEKAQRPDAAAMHRKVVDYKVEPKLAKEKTFEQKITKFAESVKKEQETGPEKPVEKTKQERAKEKYLKRAQAAIFEFQEGKISGKEILKFAEIIKSTQMKFGKDGLEITNPAISAIGVESPETRGAMVDAMIEYAKTQKMKPEEIRGYVNYFEAKGHAGSTENYKWLMGKEPQTEVKEEKTNQKNKESESGRVYKLSDHEYRNAKLPFNEPDMEKWSIALATLINTTGKDNPLMPRWEQISQFWFVPDRQVNKLDLVMQTRENTEVTVEIGFNDEEKSTVVKTIFAKDLPKK